MYVLTGCAGSGTGWASILMTKLGSPCGHEDVYTHLGRVSGGELEGDSSWYAVPLVAREEPSVCLMRDPLAVVRSLVRLQAFHNLAYYSAGYYLRHIPGIGEAVDVLGRAIRYVAWWDSAVAEKLPIFRVEDAEPANVMTLFGYLTGRHPEVDIGDTLAQVGTSVNSHGGNRSTITWKQIRDHPDGDLLVAKAQRFGYPTEDGNDGESAAAT
jgi:hypothetical protein